MACSAALVRWREEGGGELEFVAVFNEILLAPRDIICPTFEEVV